MIDAQLRIHEPLPVPPDFAGFCRGTPGQPFTEVIPPAFHAEAAALFAGDDACNGERSTKVRRVTGSDGATRFAQLTAAPVAGGSLFTCSLREVFLAEDIWPPGQPAAPEAVPQPPEPGDPFAVIFNQVPVQMAVFDPQYRFLYINPQAVKDAVLRAWLIGKDDFDYCRYRKRDNSLALHRRERFEAVTRTRGPQEWEETHMTRENTPVVVRWTLTPVFYPDGTLRMIIASGADLTSIRNAERQVREEQAKFMLLARNVKEVFYIRNPELTRFVYVSPAFEQVWGYPCQQLLDDPKTWYRAVHPEDKPRLKTLNVFLSPGQQLDAEFRIIRPDGTQRWVQARQFLVFDQESHLSYVVGLSEDITERKMAELAVRNRARQFKHIFENAPIAMAIASIDGRLVLVNDAMESTFGYSKEELLKCNLAALSMSEDMPENRALRRRLLSGQTDHFQVNKRFVHKNGNVLHTLLRASLMRNSLGKPMHFLGQVVDITDLKKAEEALTRQNQELAKINAELDRFVYSTSHDLRAPLTSLLGLVNLMEGEPLSHDAREYLRMMRTSIGRMDAFISEIADYSRNARTAVVTEPLDLGQLARDCFNDLHHLPGAASIRKEVCTPPPGTLHGDGRRLKIVLNNLIANAILYHAPWQPEPFVRVEATTGADEWLVRVSDNGKGIPPQHQGRIFDMFYRASDDTKGSGLGLYIVKETVSKMGGDVQVRSALGAGSTFTIRLPHRETGTTTF
ncbi:MAG: PAS domain-containing sensor histidine kinase [Cytophagales bacterium]|nr:PAS domain-containing sensor histidine kinase [Cytophagales bacterium]